MIRLEKKILQFIVFLVVLKILDFFTNTFSYDILQMLGIEYSEEIYGRIRNTIPFIYSNVAFSIILFFYGRKQIENRIIIPILSLFSPIAAIIFYFIESEFTKRLIN